MTLITRQGKGSRISTQEMDNNMDYLERNSTINITGITSQIGPFDEDKINYINKIDVTENETLYRGVLYGEYESPTSEIILKYNDSVNNQLDINFEFGDSYYLNGSMIYKRNDVYEIVRFSSILEYRPSVNGNSSPSLINMGFNFIVTTIQVQPDGKFLVGGRFTYSGSGGIMRFNFDGTIDSTFWTGDGFNNTVFNNTPNSIQIQSDGKILVGGSFTVYNNISRNRFFRLNSNGSIDDTFNIGTGFNNTVNSIQLQSDGKILVGGGFSSYNSVSTNCIIRFNSDGSRDNTFNIGTGFNNAVNSIQIQSDGKILLGGNFTSYNGTSSNRIIRLNSDGSIDNTFNIGTGFNDVVRTITIQSDGKILVGGGFTSYNETTKNRIIRLNTDGSIDNTFNIGTGFNDVVQTIQVQSDGKVFAGGGFTSYDETTRNRFTRINSDGSIDSTFNTGFGFNNNVNVISLKSDMTLFIGGDFTEYSDSFFRYFIKMNNNYVSQSYIYNPNTFGRDSGGNSFGKLDVNSEGKLTLLIKFNTEKFILDFNLTQIKN